MELIVVLIVMGILAAVGVAKFGDTGGMDARAYADQVRSIVRYAQKLSVAQQRKVYIVSDGTTVAACYGDPCAANNIVVAPSGANSGTTATRAACRIDGVYQQNWLCEARPPGVTLAQNFGTTTFNFYRNGSPSFAAASNVLVVSGVGSLTVTVEGQTGYVH